MCLGQELVPRIPRLAGVAPHEPDVEAPLEQFDLGLRLVVPVVPLPRPRVPGSRMLRRDDDAAEVPFHRSLDRIGLVRPGLVWLDRKLRLVHQEVVPVEPMPTCLLAAELRSRADVRSARQSHGEDHGCERRHCCLLTGGRPFVNSCVPPLSNKKHCTNPLTTKLKRTSLAKASFVTGKTDL